MSEHVWHHQLYNKMDGASGFRMKVKAEVIAIKSLLIIIFQKKITE